MRVKGINVRVKNSTHILFGLISLIFGLAYSVSRGILRTDMISIKAVEVLAAAIIVATTLYAVYFLLNTKGKTENVWESKTVKFLYIKILASIMLVYGVFFLAYFPGTAVNDSLMIYRNGMMMANASPPIYCLFIVIFQIIGNFLCSARTGVILCNIVQLLVVCAMSAWIVAWVFKKPFVKWIKLLTLVYFLFNPLLIIFSFCMIKDTLFSVAVIVLFLLSYDLIIGKIELKTEHWIVFLLDVVLLVSFRNGVLYVAVVYLLCLVFTQKSRKYRRNLFVILLCVLATGGFSKFLEKRFDTEYLAREMMAIPIQQLAATVCYDGNLTTEQETVINDMMDLELIKEKYSPYYVDSIKWDIQFNDKYCNENTGEILKVWLQAFPNNIGIYTKAYLCETFYFWAPIQQGEVKIFRTVEDLFPEWHQEHNIVDTPLLPGPITEKLQSYCELAEHFLREGVLFWIMIFCMLELYVLTEDKRVFALYAVCLLQWIVLMVSTPVCQSIRYVLSYAYGLPVFFALLFLKTKDY